MSGFGRGPFLVFSFHLVPFYRQKSFALLGNYTVEASWRLTNRDQV